MIAYDLKCDSEHTFEGWFESAQAYEQQNEKGLISCPFCGSTAINRAPSTFGIARHRDQTSKDQPRPEQLLRKFVEDNFEDVGTDFAKEALKIHYQVSESRNIRGVSTEQEEEMLRQEGVSFFKLPTFSYSDKDDDE
ncbi:MAG: DUF1178 family protein [Deltaproteobacteria bacterium]|nr:DUF1178 family protein [Deltaproteobacteria bacterium]